MFCQACGAKNAVDSRFCNMCGARIAAAGTPGGAVHEPTRLGVGVSAPSTTARPGDHTVAMAPTASSNTTSISLDAIGVRSARKTWTILGLSAIALLCVGALGSYVYMRAGVKSAGAAAPEDPFMLGAPTVATSGAGTTATEAHPTEAAPIGVAPTNAPTEAANAPSDARTPRETTRTSAMHETVARTNEPGPDRTTTSSMAADAGATTTATTATTTATTATTTTASNPTTMSDDGTPQDATGTDRDLEMELYQGRVRYLVRRYYMADAQRCFDHATSNNPSLHGQVIVALQIGANGYVTDSSVARNSTGDDTLGSCLASQTRSWRLSAPPGGEAIQMNMPFSR